MNAFDAHRLELQTFMLQAELDGDIEAAEMYQQMLDEFDEYCEEDLGL
jgi:hypothetical protein